MGPKFPTMEHGNCHKEFGCIPIPHKNLKGARGQKTWQNFLLTRNLKQKPSPKLSQGTASRW